MSLLLEERFVIVLGAGAKPFLPSAPLAEDDYDLKHCLVQFAGFPYARK